MGLGFMGLGFMRLRLWVRVMWWEIWVWGGCEARVMGYMVWQISDCQS